MAAASLTLLIPGLLARLPGAEALPAAQWPTPQGLHALLRFATPETAPATGLDAALAARFGLATETPVPVAALTRHLDGAAPDAAIWLRADPIYLQADRDSLRLLDADPELSEQEAHALAQHLNTHFAADGWQIDVRTPNRWYVRGDNLPPLQTPAPRCLLTQRIDHKLPAERSWHRRLNEVQMCLHQAPVNVAREAQGRLPVNSLWFWGAGRLPQAHADYNGVWSTEPLARALAKRAGITEHACDPAWPGEVLAHLGGRNLLVLDVLQEALAGADLFAWLAGLASLEQQWLAPLWTCVQRGALGELLLDSGDGRMWRIERPRLWQRWIRRRRPLLDYLVAPA